MVDWSQLTLSLTLDTSKIEISKKHALQYEMQSWGKKQEIANKNKIKKRGYETHKVNVA